MKRIGEFLSYSPDLSKSTFELEMNREFIPIQGGIRAQAYETVSGGKRDIRLSAYAESRCQGAGLCVRFEFQDWNRENYVLVPAAVYNGNRFAVHPGDYPPMFRPEEYCLDTPITIADIPRLELEKAEGALSLRAGDGATPAVGIFLPREKRGVILLYPSRCEGDKPGENGVEIREYEQQSSLCCSIRIQSPVIREGGMYRFGKFSTSVPCEDLPITLEAGEKLSLTVRTYEFPCESVTELFRELTAHRKELAGPSTRPDILPFSQAFQRIEEKFNRCNWHKSGKFYCVGENTSLFSCWQTGWVGGINAAYALYMEGTGETKARALQTVEFMFSRMQAPSGLFYGIFDGSRIWGDDFANIENKSFGLIRKSADALYFSALIFLRMRQAGEAIPPAWTDGLCRCAEAFCALWKRYGQFGQFADVDKGTILVGNSASGAMAIAGLALCSILFQDRNMRITAEEAGEYYYQEYVCRGITNGGPGEILSAPDSESAYALLEGFVCLYECTENEKWRDCAEDMAVQYASWCMSYDYVFPPQSQFGIHDMRTSGAVWANVQNKHGAPGVCTHSGSALFRLYRYTGKAVYLELCQDTAHNITQYISRDDRPLLDYTGEKAAPSGFMCERVSTSDWEGFEKIGGIYAEGCWCEGSALCTYADIPGIYVDPQRELVVQFDHVCGKLRKDGALELTNNTSFDSLIKVMIEQGKGFDYIPEMEKVFVPAGGKAERYLTKIKSHVNGAR